MRKRIAGKRAAGPKSQRPKTRGRFSEAGAAGLVLIILSACAALALFKTARLRPAPALRSAPAVAPLQSQNIFAPQGPSKEYIRAGGTT